jgi:hypothetical protein
MATIDLLMGCDEHAKRPHHDCARCVGASNSAGRYLPRTRDALGELEIILAIQAARVAHGDARANGTDLRRVAERFGRERNLEGAEALALVQGLPQLGAI